MDLSKYLSQQQSSNTTAFTERAKVGKNIYTVQGYPFNFM